MNNKLVFLDKIQQQIFSQTDNLNFYIWYVTFHIMQNVKQLASYLPDG